MRSIRRQRSELKVSATKKATDAAKSSKEKHSTRTRAFLIFRKELEAHPLYSSNYSARHDSTAELDQSPASLQMQKVDAFKRGILTSYSLWKTVSWRKIMDKELFVHYRSLSLSTLLRFSEVFTDFDPEHSFCRLQTFSWVSGLQPMLKSKENACPPTLSSLIDEKQRLKNGFAGKGS